MIELRNKGLTFQQIANIYGISRQRVHVIINNKSYPQVVLD